MFTEKSTIKLCECVCIRLCVFVCMFDRMKVKDWHFRRTIEHRERENGLNIKKNRYRSHYVHLYDGVSVPACIYRFRIQFILSVQRAYIRIYAFECRKRFHHRLRYHCRRRRRRRCPRSHCIAERYVQREKYFTFTALCVYFTRIHTTKKKDRDKLKPCLFLCKRFNHNVHILLNISYQIFEVEIKRTKCFINGFGLPTHKLNSRSFFCCLCTVAFSPSSSSFTRRRFSECGSVSVHIFVYVCTMPWKMAYTRRQREKAFSKIADCRSVETVQKWNRRIFDMFEVTLIMILNNGFKRRKKGQS